jgi:hypothetical protein
MQKVKGGVDKIAVDARTAGHGMKDRGASLCRHDEPYDPLVFALHAMMSLLVCLALELAACLLHRCPPPLLLLLPALLHAVCRRACVCSFGTQSIIYLGLNFSTSKHPLVIL